jgi:hypothetical protein
MKLVLAASLWWPPLKVVPRVSLLSDEQLPHLEARKKEQWVAWST